jgi:competence ComEA-like helix-hairpin-helix protein
MRKKHDNAYLHFTKKERKGIMALLFFILLLILIPFFYPLVFKEKITGDKYQDDIVSLKMRSPDSGRRFSYKTAGTAEYHSYHAASQKTDATAAGALFYFDPNTIGANDWRRLGVKENTITTIQRYLSKGGKFREPEDIKKIWGLREEQVRRLLPYVKITAAAPGDVPAHAYQKRAAVNMADIHIDLNDADSAAFVSLPGIGPAFSRRIVNYRERLGGFYSVEQVSETFGLPDSVFKKIRPSLHAGTGQVRQININTATLEELKAHPYIRYHLANAIVQYRQQHGNFTAVTDIKHIMLVDEALFKKVSPYLIAE